MKIEEIYKVVEKINEKYFENLSEDRLYYLEIRTNGYGTKVVFMNNTLWKDYDDEREWIEEKNDYEPIEEYLKNKIIEILQPMFNVLYELTDGDCCNYLFHSGCSLINILEDRRMD